MDFKKKIEKVFGGNLPDIFHLNVDGILETALKAQGFSVDDILEPIRINDINFSILIQEYITGLNSRSRTPEEKIAEQKASEEPENARRQLGVLFRSQFVEIIQDKELDIHSKIGYCIFTRSLLQAYHYIYRQDWVDDQSNFVRELFDVEIHYKKEYNRFLAWQQQQSANQQSQLIKPI